MTAESVLSATKLLHIGKRSEGGSFSLPLSFATMTQAILARKRSGKSYTASVQAEELLENKQQVIVFDPTSAWHGLRSSADGKGEGYPIVVFGGDHADAPLDFRAGKAMAAAVVEHGFSAIFDIGNLHTDEQILFVMDFCSELLRINRTALHVFMDEADTFAPQRSLGLLQNKCLGTVSRLVKQGGIRGIGFTMITQRPASINKDVLSQVDLLTVLRMSHPLDVGAAIDWIQSEVGADFAKEVKPALPGLPVGTAFFCSASQELGVRVVVRKRTTFNSGATPKPGERKVEPKVLARVDIEKLGKEISSAAEKAMRNSPEFLKKRIKELEDAAAKAPNSIGPKSITPERERMLLAQISRLQKTAGAYEKAMAAIAVQTNKMAISAAAIRDLIEGLKEDGAQEDLPASPAEASPAIAPTPIRPRPALPRPEADSEQGDFTDSLSVPEQRILDSIRWFEAIGITYPEQGAVAFFAGYSLTSSSFKNPRGALNRKGLISTSNDGTIALTEEGGKRANDPVIERTNEALQQAVLGKIAAPEQKLLRPLLRVYPEGMTSEQLASEAGYSLTSSSFKNPRGKLKSLGLTELRNGFIYARNVLFPEG